MAEGEFPKSDGQVLYGSEANAFWIGLKDTTMNYNNVSVATTATSIVSSDAQRKSLTMKNNGSTTIYLGNDGSVTTSNGYPLEPGKEMFLEYAKSREAWYGIVSSGTVDLRYVDVT